MTTVGVSSKVLLGTFTLSNLNIDETVLRTVGSLSVTSDQASVTEPQIGALGMILVNDLALAAGAASIPGPITDRSDDGWFVYILIVSNMLVNTAVGFDALAGARYDFDSKAKRRVEEGFGIAIMIENASAASAFLAALVFRSLSQIS